ncbi:hypothetical protein LTR48_002192 [Friedmanniomyces endolithicus]|uniref:Alpha/beta hydrolase fold-3 domain-containing protein n=1 Tax=Rachicladosporium monterosium TaxID=1507873 RepID=A0ABR0LDH2_9PEZI|nr:hypothetical protein LTR29_004956 [Friedmanniomyces endolithicus]KAK1093505.1 hypothetical protein LTR48_002192 [Friedmanniomyces endolithicus]KAK5146418.1 hypothetical protein LTR32_001981 [Rachicladosporium monterosium]
MQSTRIPYKTDDYGNPIYARVSWSTATQSPRPIALIYHGGGLMVGSSEMIPKPQTEYRCSKGFLVVAPNYRLVPQVSGRQAFADAVYAYDWTTTDLPKLLQAEHSLEIDSAQIVAMGHSSGGTLALHIASCRSLKAATAFYPSLFLADPTTSMHRPTTAPPFGLMPDFTPTKEDSASIEPAGLQVSEAPLAIPGSIPQPRNKWQMHVIKHGQWPQTAQPDGDYAAMDPMTRVSARWPPVMIVQGEVDDVPGSGLELAERAEREMKAAGVREVVVEVVAGERHMFDLPPSVGTVDMGPKWEAVVKGLEWLASHVGGVH